MLKRSKENYFCFFIVKWLRRKLKAFLYKLPETFHLNFTKCEATFSNFCSKGFPTNSINVEMTEKSLSCDLFKEKKNIKNFLRAGEFFFALMAKGNVKRAEITSWKRKLLSSETKWLGHKTTLAQLWSSAEDFDSVKLFFTTIAHKKICVSIVFKTKAFFSETRCLKVFAKLHLFCVRFFVFVLIKDVAEKNHYCSFFPTCLLPVVFKCDISAAKNVAFCWSTKEFFNEKTESNRDVVNSKFMWCVVNLSVLLF